MGKARSRLVDYASRTFRDAYGFTTEMHFGRQAKHLPDSPEFIPGRSVVTLPVEEIQELIAKYGGTGVRKGANKEIIDFGFPIGYFYDRDTHEFIETTRGIIHYSASGAHIVPARPIENNKEES